MKPSTSPESRLIRARTRKIKIGNDRLSADYIDRARFLRDLARIDVGSRKTFDRRITDEWSLAITSLDVPSGRGLGRRVEDLIIHDLKQQLEAPDFRSGKTK